MSLSLGKGFFEKHNNLWRTKWMELEVRQDAPSPLPRGGSGRQIIKDTHYFFLLSHMNTANPKSIISYLSLCKNNIIELSGFRQKHRNFRKANSYCEHGSASGTERAGRSL